MAGDDITMEVRKRIREEARAGNAFKRRFNAIDRITVKYLKAIAAQLSRRRAVSLRPASAIVRGAATARAPACEPARNRGRPRKNP
jgi:hypothetical protein